ncbi:MAG: zinc-ribbon domain-containing protein [Deltaproteobacteria bacterium]|nr:zinc-ribbon domain-containing protein [Deltaproteobacteria bacterium]
MNDMTLVCIQCGNSFVFSAAEQARFLALDFASPRRCPECRKKKAKRIEDGEKWDKDDRKRRVLRRKRHSFYDDDE